MADRYDIEIKVSKTGQETTWTSGYSREKETTHEYAAHTTAAPRKVAADLLRAMADEIDPRPAAWVHPVDADGGIRTFRTPIPNGPAL